MGVQREPGQKGVSWSNIAVGKFNPSSDATRADLILTPHSRTGGIMNMVISFSAVWVTFAERHTQFCPFQPTVCESCLESCFVLPLLTDSGL